ncbi:MAG: BolA family transcriptional regulator [Proteobacteria bacterium]|nr:BolA family transcriptional regulator [Pseudomonadota bacterium]
MERARRIRDILKTALEAEAVEVVDESARHAGHAGARPGGETHYRVRVIAAAFRGRSPIERHQMVYAALAGEFGTGLHALALATLAPEEAGG